MTQRHTPVLAPATEMLLRSEGLRRLWGPARGRLEQNGLIPKGILVIDDLNDRERGDLSGLLGRRITGTRVRVDLASLDDTLRASAAQRGLADVLELLNGPLIDRKALRLDAQTARDLRASGARDAAITEGLSAHAWCDAWLESIKPVLSRLDPHSADATAREAARTLSMLPLLSLEGYSEIARNDLAVMITGSAHGLDDDTTLSAMVLRGVAAAKGIGIPTTAMERRALWREAGVITDSVSSTVLTLGLRPLGPGKREREMRDRADDSLETHLTARDLSRIQWRLAAFTTIYVCENPRIVEAASDARSQAALVCTFGNPNSVVLDLLSHLHGAGAELWYHGDFDWPGIAIANRVIAHVGATSWQMDAADYLAAVASATGELPSLAGKPISASWDLALEQVMLETGQAVHEEFVLDRLLTDLVS